jgi:hypothetical protein
MSQTIGLTAPITKKPVSESKKVNNSSSKDILINKIITSSQAASLPDRILDRTLETCKPGSKSDLGLMNSLPFTKDMPDTKQQEMQARMDKGKEIFREQVQKYRSILELPKFLPSVLSSLLSKYYSDQDLQTILKFWQSPTGQKTAALLPQIQGDYVKMGFEYFVPKFIEIFKDIMQNPEVQNRLNSFKMQRLQQSEDTIQTPHPTNSNTFKIESKPNSETAPAVPTPTPKSNKPEGEPIKELLN